MDSANLKKKIMIWSQPTRELKPTKNKVKPAGRTGQSRQDKVGRKLLGKFLGYWPVKRKKYILSKL